jgi:riboflavin kinase
MILSGIVRSGKNDFSYWLKLLEPFYTAKTGMKLFPGTLNVHLIDRFYSLPHKVMRLEKEEYGGRVSVSIVPCKIFSRNAFILRTDSDTGKYGDPPEKILEIAADVKLRDVYSLQDGDCVSIEISDSLED